MNNIAEVQYLQIMPQSKILHLDPNILGIIFVNRPFQKARINNTSQKTKYNCRKSILLLAFLVPAFWLLAFWQNHQSGWPQILECLNIG